jgi:hypothetical protein
MVVLWLFDASKSWLNIFQKSRLSIMKAGDKSDSVPLLFNHVKIIRFSSESILISVVFEVNIELF